MSLELTIQPPSLIFSADLISVRIRSDNHLAQTARSSINYLNLTFPLSGSISLAYGMKVVNLTVSNSPDVDGTTIPSTAETAQDVVDVLVRNYDLTNDFDIEAAASNSIKFTSKRQELGFDFSPMSFGAFSVINSVTGRPAVLKPNYAIRFSLYIENAENDGFEEISTQSLIVGIDGLVDVPVAANLHDAIMRDLRKKFEDIPEADPLQCKSTCRKYYFTYAETYGAAPKTYFRYTSDRYTVLQGGLSYVKQFNSTLQDLISPGQPEQDRFLKQGNNEVYTRSNQPQYLYFFNTRDKYDSARIMVTWYFKDESSSSVVLKTINIETLRKYAFRVQYDTIYDPLDYPGKTVIKYDIWLQTSEGEQVSEKRTYHLNYQYREYVRYFLSWSSFGALDSRVCYGKGNGEFELFQKEAKRILKMGYDIKDGNSMAFDIKLKSRYRVATGWLTRRELIGNRDFYLSPFKFRFSGGLLLPIKIDSSTIPEIEDGNHLFSQFFEYSYLFDDHAYSEGDGDEPGISSGDFFFSYGPVSGNPTGGFHETDPTVPAWVKAITLEDITRWNLHNPPEDFKPQFITLTGDQTFVYSNDINKTVDRESITLSATEHNFVGEPADRLWEYHNGAAWVQIPNTFNTQTYELRHDAAIWNGNDSVSVRYRVGELVDQMTIVKLYSGESVLSVVVSSVYGDHFFNGNIDTTLIATVFWGGDNITDTIPETGFTWTRVSADPLGDEEWNFHEGKARKTVDIDHTDVFKKAVFNCEVEVII